MRRMAIAAFAASLALFIGVFLHRVLDITRGSPVRALGDEAGPPPAVRESRFPDVAAVLSQTALHHGNAIELFFHGPPLFDRLYADLRGAQRSISFQPYYCGSGLVVDSVVAILSDRADRGVQVRFVADGFGCRSFLKRHAATLRRAGVQVAVLRPIRWYTLHKAQHRSHVRVVVIDGVLAYTGGFGVDDKWLTADGVGWRETSVRFTGPAASAAQAAFLSAWAEATGELLAGDVVLPDPSLTITQHVSGSEAAESATTREPARAIAGIQFAGPRLGTTPFERMLVLSIAGAQDRLYITNAYFVPSAPIRALLQQAALRGVDVRILTAGVRSDVPTTRIAARAYYDALLAAGVRIYEYVPTMMHAKTLVADGVWLAVGGMNLDNRSMRLNDELNLLAYDAVLGKRLEQAFVDDLGRSREVTLADHRLRSNRQRLFERGVRWIAPLL